MPAVWQANVLFTVELQRRIEAAGLRASAVSLHPGVVQTDLARYIVGGVSASGMHMHTPSLRTMHALPAAGHSGRRMSRCMHGSVDSSTLGGGRWEQRTHGCPRPPRRRPDLESSSRQGSMLCCSHPKRAPIHRWPSLPPRCSAYAYIYIYVPYIYICTVPLPFRPCAWPEC